jgi:hypothetical protein
VGDITERHRDLGALDRVELAGDAGIVTGELAEKVSLVSSSMFQVRLGAML